MTKIEAEKLLRRVRLELARDHEFPSGSRERGYDFIAPLDAKGHIVLEAWKELKDRCRVRRFWAHAPEEVGHIVHKSAGRDQQRCTQALEAFDPVQVPED